MWFNTKIECFHTHTHAAEKKLFFMQKLPSKCAIIILSVTAETHREYYILYRSWSMASSHITNLLSFLLLHQQPIPFQFCSIQNIHHCHYLCDVMSSLLFVRSFALQLPYNLNEINLVEIKEYTKINCKPKKKKLRNEKRRE